MKKLLKNNQVIITALAILIAIAGYLNYAQRIGNENDYQAAIGKDITDKKTDLFDISEEDILAENQAFLDKMKELRLEENVDEPAETAHTDDIQSPDGDIEPAGSSIPGEAVLTGGTMEVNSIIGIKLKREQAKSLQKAALMEIINSEGVTEAQKKTATEQLIEATGLAEREAAAEFLLEAKGFEDVVVSINNGTVDVVVNSEQLSDAQRAQIEDIVKRKTEISASKIVITPFKANK